MNRGKIFFRRRAKALASLRDNRERGLSKEATDFKNCVGLRRRGKRSVRRVSVGTEKAPRPRYEGANVGG